MQRADRVLIVRARVNDCTRVHDRCLIDIFWLKTRSRAISRQWSWGSRTFERAPTPVANGRWGLRSSESGRPGYVAGALMHSVSAGLGRAGDKGSNSSGGV